MNPWFTYTDEQRNAIRTVVHDRLGKDADQIECQVMRYGRTGTLSLLDRIEAAASAHIPRSAFESQTPGHKKLIKQLTALRNGAKALRNGIDAITLSFTHKGVKLFPPASFRPIPRDTCDKTKRVLAEVVNAIDAYIAAQRPPTGNASKTARDPCWNQLLAIWCEIGGKPTGVAAAAFLKAASVPVMLGGVPTLASIMRWLDRRQNKTAKTVKNPVLRRTAR